MGQPDSLTSTGRPSAITRDGWTVLIGVHDEYFRREVRRWRQRLAAAHPDAGGSHRAYLRVTAQRDRWLARESAWYAEHGVPLPSLDREAHPAPATLRRRTHRGLLRLLQDGRLHDAAALMASLHCSMNALNAGISRLRAKGLRIALVRFGPERTYFQLLGRVEEFSSRA